MGRAEGHPGRDQRSAAQNAPLEHDDIRCVARLERRPPDDADGTIVAFLALVDIIEVQIESGDWFPVQIRVRVRRIGR